MNIIEQAKGLIAKGEVKEASINFLEDGVNAFLGDPISIGKILLALAKSPLFIREQLFWVKMEAFLNGVYLSEEDRGNLRAKIWRDGEYGDNPRRLIECIDRAETKQKIGYLINATRCLLSDYIDLSTYFRICHAITQTLDEDLSFLGENINEKDIPYGLHVQGLLTSGLMYQSVIDANGEQKYSFTPLAECVDRYAVSYNNVERYPMTVRYVATSSSPQPKLPGIPEWEEVSDEEIDNLFK